MTDAHVVRPQQSAQDEPLRGWVDELAQFRASGDDQAYTLVQDDPVAHDGEGPPRRHTAHMVECWPRSPDGGGALTAISRAAQLSLSGEPVTVLLPDNSPLARFVGGCREGRTRPLLAPVRMVD